MCVLSLSREPLSKEAIIAEAEGIARGKYLTDIATSEINRRKKTPRRTEGSYLSIAPAN